MKLNIQGWLLKNKINIDADNISTDGLKFLSGLGMPLTKTALTVGSSGTSYTAPENGFFFAKGNWNSFGSGFYLTFDNTTRGFGTMSQTGGAGPSFGKCICPALKGDSVKLSYNLITINDLAFFTSKGGV